MPVVTSTVLTGVISLENESGFMAVSVPGGVYDDRTVDLSYACSPTGPWSTPHAVYTIPQLSQYSDEIAYMATFHPDISSGSGLVISYDINSTAGLSELESNVHAYQPQFLLLDSCGPPPTSRSWTTRPTALRRLACGRPSEVKPFGSQVTRPSTSASFARAVPRHDACRLRAPVGSRLGHRLPVGEGSSLGPNRDAQGDRVRVGRGIPKGFPAMIVSSQDQQVSPAVRVTGRPKLVAVSWRDPAHPPAGRAEVLWTASLAGCGLRAAARGHGVTLSSVGIPLRSDTPSRWSMPAEPIRSTHGPRDLCAAVSPCRRSH